MGLKDKIKKMDNVIAKLVSDDVTELNTYTVNGSYEDYDPSNDFRKQVIEKGYVITKLFACYYQGWECDEWSCEAKDINGLIYSISTDHGKLVVEVL